MTAARSVVAKRTEAEVKRAIETWLTYNRIWFRRMNSGMAMLPGRNGKPMPVRFGSPGMADLLVVLPRKLPAHIEADYGRLTRMAWIECKRPLGPKGGTGGSDQSDDQRAFQSEVEVLGCRYIVARSVDDVIAALGVCDRTGAGGGE